MIKETKKRKLKGIIVSDKMNKTRVVEINQLVRHFKYDKYHKVRTKIKAHDENNEYKSGDQVTIELTRPISKEKKWKIVSK